MIFPSASKVKSASGRRQFSSSPGNKSLVRGLPWLARVSLASRANWSVSLVVSKGILKPGMKVPSRELPLVGRERIFDSCEYEGTDVSEFGRSRLSVSSVKSGKKAGSSSRSNWSGL